MPPSSSSSSSSNPSRRSTNPTQRRRIADEDEDGDEDGDEDEDGASRNSRAERDNWWQSAPALNHADRFRFFVTCARGTEGALRRELVGLRIGSPKGDAGGVGFEGPLRMAMAVCLYSRV